MTVRTRFAPSPTGVLHLGSIRTALFCWLYARHTGGEYLVRIEDTDRERSTDENVTAIFEGLSWLGITSDKEPVYQTRRFDRYREVIAQWLDNGKAYHCYCSRERLAAVREEQMAAGLKTRYDGRCRDGAEPVDGVNPVVRFRNPTDGDVLVEDLVRGEVVFSNRELDDLIICRSDGTPTYNFTVVVDDADMGISHVIRGDDHLNNTPRQMNMFAALGVTPPGFAHLPMILGPDGAKLSKRHGAVDIRDYQQQGYLPAALLNYLVRLGWSHADQEIFSVEEMIELFDIANVNQSASAFNPEKLRWLNQQHIKAMPADELGTLLRPFLERAGLAVDSGPEPSAVADAYRERAETLVELAASCQYLYNDFAEIDPKAAKKNLRPVVLESLLDVRERLAALPEWRAKELMEAIEASAAAFELNMGKLGQPLRVAVTGNGVSPPIDITLELIGRERSLQRLDRALELIRDRAAAS